VVEKIAETRFYKAPISVNTRILKGHIMPDIKITYFDTHVKWI
jgi:hypothetical protein